MKYYVYELINSLDNKPFYIGKGTKNRMYVHEYRAKKDKLCVNETRKLRNKIRSIWKKGGKICYNQIFFSDNNDEVFKKEIERIKEVGLDNLCNIFISPPSPEEVYKLRSKRMMGHITSEITKQKISQSLTGHSVSEETKQKISNTKKGKKRPCSDLQRKRIIEARTPDGGWKDLMSPYGEKVSVYSISDICRKYGLNPSAITELYQGKHSHHHGWKVAS